MNRETREETIANRVTDESFSELNKTRSHLVEKASFYMMFIVGKLRQCIFMFKANIKQSSYLYLVLNMYNNYLIFSTMPLCF